jgi:perosamine synthetase
MSNDANPVNKGRTLPPYLHNHREEAAKDSVSLLNRMRMIPRYNWDYGVIDLCKALAASVLPLSRGESPLSGLFKGKHYFTTSGRVSLYTILRSLDLPQKAFVGVPLFCCPVVFDAVKQAGFTPRFLDITSDTYTLSPADIEKKRAGLAAIVAVHMFGHPADMDAILSAAGPVPVIEDCAQSLFSTYKGRYVGGFGTVSFFSFRSGKHISAGEGSAIICNSPVIADRVKTAVASYAAWRPLKAVLHCVSTYVKSALYHRPWFGTVGYPIGIRLDKKLNLTAKTGFTIRQISSGDRAIIEQRLGRFKTNIEKQRANARFYLSEIKRVNALALPVEKKDCQSNYYQFAIRTADTAQRDRLAAHLNKNGIDSVRYLDGISHEAEPFGYAGDCPVAEECSRTVLTIPVYYSLSGTDLARIAESINEFHG